MNKLVHSTDFTWAMCQVFIWSCVEPFIGILCACLPTYAPLVRKWNSVSASQHGKQQSLPDYYKSPENSNATKGFNGRIHGPSDTTLHGDDEIGLTANPGVSNGSKGYTYEIHSKSGSQKPKSNQDILVRTDFSLSTSA